MHNEVWVCGFILLFLFMGFATFCIPYTGARASSPLSRVCCAILERFLERSSERALNFGKSGAF